MFRSTHLAKLFPLSLSMLLVTAIGTTGQGEKTPSKNQVPTTKRAESVPVVVGRGSDSREDSHVTLPSDPLVILLRSLGFPTDQNPVSAKRQPDSTSSDNLNWSNEERDFPFIFCGSSGISAEGFEALQEFWEFPSPGNYAPQPSPREVTRSDDDFNRSTEERDCLSFIFCGRSEICPEDFEVSQDLWWAPSLGNYAPQPSRGEVTKSNRRTSSKRSKVGRN